MIALPLFPIWLLEYLAGVVVIIFALLAWRYSRRLMTQDPENALWLFFNWLAVTFVLFSITPIVSHFIQDLSRFRGSSGTLDTLRRLMEGIDSIVYVAITTITLFFS